MTTLINNNEQIILCFTYAMISTINIDLYVNILSESQLK